MNLHITPSFNIDRLCKTASVLLFLVNIATWVLIVTKYFIGRHSEHGCPNRLALMVKVCINYALKVIVAFIIIYDPYLVDLILSYIDPAIRFLLRR